MGALRGAYFIGIDIMQDDEREIAVIEKKIDEAYKELINLKSRLGIDLEEEAEALIEVKRLALKLGWSRFEDAVREFFSQDDGH